MTTIFEVVAPMAMAVTTSFCRSRAAVDLAATRHVGCRNDYYRLCGCYEN
ncbi:MAG: hypothetical protein K2G49_05350 [Muribaculum sp.]|nr:hypothetical protein [Muribaculum sp.]